MEGATAKKKPETKVGLEQQSPLYLRRYALTEKLNFSCGLTLDKNMLQTQDGRSVTLTNYEQLLILGLLWNSETGRWLTRDDIFRTLYDIAENEPGSPATLLSVTFSKLKPKLATLGWKIVKRLSKSSSLDNSGTKYRLEKEA